MTPIEEALRDVFGSAVGGAYPPAMLLQAVSTRIELAAVELEAQRRYVVRQCLLGLVAVLGAAGGIVLAIVGVVLAAPAEWRPAVLGAGAALALAGTAVIAGWMHLRRRDQAPLLQSTLDVLRADALALRSAVGR